MPRLFVAVDLPTQVTAALVAIQPADVPGLRLVDRSRMHLTLHFLGNADVERTSAALRDVASLAVPVSIRGVGRFPGRMTTLWAGVRESGGLSELHARIATALSQVGFRPEDRRYHPHITLARCEPRVPASVVTQFLDRHAAFSLPDFAATTVSLYSSDLSGAAPAYRRESSFELASPG